MTDRYYALTVTLTEPIRDDDAEAIINAIRMIKGVNNVVPLVAEADLHWAAERAKRELGEKILELIYPKTKAGQ
jgi:hypothetical protein